MRRDKTKAVLSTIAALTSVALILVYWLAPANADSHRLHILLIDCIPDAVVVLIAMPIVYWLLYRRGLTNMGDCPLFSPGGGAAALEPPAHACRHSPPGGPDKDARPAENDDGPSGPQDVLLVLDNAGGLGTGARSARAVENAFDALNAALHAAETDAILVLFAHRPAEQEDPSPSDGSGASAYEIYRPAGCAVLDLDLSTSSGSGSALANPVLEMILANSTVRTVYVAGGTLEHSVRATCRGILQRGKKTIALETTILSASDRTSASEEVWRELVAEGLVRIEQLPGRDEQSPPH